MFRNLKAIRRGQKLAEITCKITSEIVNFLIYSGKEIGTLDTTLVLLQINSFIRFCSFVKALPRSDMETGLIINNSNDIIHDWLQKIWSETYTKAQLSDTITTVMNEMEPHFLEWTKQFHERNSLLQGRPLEQIFPKAIDITINNLNEILGDRQEDNISNEIRNMIIRSMKELR